MGVDVEPFVVSGGVGGAGTRTSTKNVGDGVGSISPFRLLGVGFRALEPTNTLNRPNPATTSLQKSVTGIDLLQAFG